LIFAAASLVTAGAVSAQAQVVKADIPFAFRAGGKVMPAGTYRVDLGGPGGTVMIQDARWHGVVALPIDRIESKDVTARLVFECSGGSCSLVEAWPGGYTLGRAFSAPKGKRNEEAELAVVRLRPNADE
jgi:hypothetical protein